MITRRLLLTSPSHLRRVYPADRSISKATGFTLVELLISGVITVILAAALARIAVSEVNAQRAQESITRLRSDWSLASDFIEVETQLGDRLQTDQASPGCGLNAGNVRLFITGPSNSWSTTYAVRAVGNGEETNWRGPFLLVRCGPPFNLNGSEPAINTAGAVSESVIASGLPDANAFNVVTSTVANRLYRDGEATLRLAAGGGAFANSFRLRQPVNPLYGLNTDIATGLATCSGSPCATTTFPNGSGLGPVREYRPTGSVTINGDDTDEDVVYFNSPLSSASFSSACNRTSCIATVGGQAVTMFNVDALIFTDTELRM